MAGTRRRSRISDTAAVVGSRSTARRVSTTVAGSERDDAGDVEVEIAESVDNDETSRAPSPVNRSVTARCQRCKTDIGEFYNSWHKITGTYYLPALLGSYSSRLRPNGRQKAATVGTDIEGW